MGPHHCLKEYVLKSNDASCPSVAKSLMDESTKSLQRRIPVPPDTIESSNSMEPPPLPRKRTRSVEDPIKSPVVISKVVPLSKKSTNPKESRQTPEEKLSELKSLVVNIPDDRDIEMIHQEWQDSPPPTVAVLPPGPQWPIKKLDLGKIPLGAPDWHDELLEQLGDDEKKSLKRKSARILHSKPPSQIEVTESDLNLGNHGTDLDGILRSQTKLPLLCKVTEQYSAPGCSVAVDKDVILLMHYPAKIYRVHAVDKDGAEFWLPIHAKQTYERFPMDPRHDNKRYSGTTALANAKPLPNAVRVMEAHCADNPRNQAEKDEIVVISHVEMGEDNHGNTQKIVVGKIGESQNVRLGEDQDCAEYSTMLSDEDLPMSELIKFDFPQRVRLVGTEGDEHKMLKLLSYEKEHHIICTRPNNKETINSNLTVTPTSPKGIAPPPVKPKPKSRHVGYVDTSKVFSIPLTCPIKLKPIVGDWALCKEALPPLYPLVNHTWNVRDLGRRHLPENFKQIVQPVAEVIKEWMHSYEGKIISTEVADKHIRHLKERIGDLTHENRIHTSRLPGSPIPALPPSRPGSGAPPPPRPPKSTAVKKLMKPTPAVRRTQSATTLPRTTSKKSRKPSDDEYEDIDDVREMLDEDDYEIPMDAHNKLVGVDSATATKTIEELKKLLEKKIEDIRNINIEKEHLDKKVKNLEKEREQLATQNKSYVDQIRDLHIEMDAEHKKIDETGENLYDSICSPADMGAMGGDSQIYNSPVDLRGVKPMTVENVCDMLREIHLGQYVEKFSEENIDGELLESLEDGIMKEDLKMSGLHAKRLMLEIKKRNHKK